MLLIKDRLGLRYRGCMVSRSLVRRLGIVTWNVMILFYEIRLTIFYALYELCNLLNIWKSFSWFCLCLFGFYFCIFYNLAVNSSISMDIPSHNLDKWYKRSDNIIHAIFTLFTYKIFLFLYIDENLHCGWNCLTLVEIQHQILKNHAINIWTELRKGRYMQFNLEFFL